MEIILTDYDTRIIMAVYKDVCEKSKVGLNLLSCGPKAKILTQEEMRPTH